MAASRPFRWRFVVASLCAFLGALTLLGGLAHVGIMFYAYANFGLYPVRPDTPSLNYFAVTTSNVAAAGGRLMVAASLLFAWIALLRGEKRKP
jgi:hypothetical protein